MSNSLRKLSWLAAGLGALLASRAVAHDLWIVPDSTDVTAGKMVTLKAVFGHNFPAGSAMAKPEFTKMNLIAPDGKKTAQGFKPSGIYQTTAFMPQTSGQYVVTADYLSYYAHIPGFQKGYALLAKDQLGDKKAEYVNKVFQCAKTVVGTGDTAMRPTGQIVELVPQKDPTTVKVGELLPIKAMWKGSALAPSHNDEVDIKAVWSGFQEDDDTFAFLGHPNKDGVCRVKITHPGWWLVMVEHKIPASETSKADEEMYVSTLVFHIAP